MRFRSLVTLSLVLLTGCGASSEDTADGGFTPGPDGDISGDIEIISFSASSDAISPYGTVELAWDVRGARTIEIGDSESTLVSSFGGSGRVSSGILRKTTTYTLLARAGEARATASVTVTVDWPEPEVLTYDVSPRMTTVNSFISIFWSTSNAERIRILRNGTEIANLTTMLESGAISALVNETENVFRIEAVNPDETAFREITVIAEAPPRIVRFEIDPPAVFDINATTATVTWETTGATQTQLDIDFSAIPNFPRTASGSMLVTLLPRNQTVHLSALSNLGQMDSYRRIGPPAREAEPNDQLTSAQQLFDTAAASGAINSTLDVDFYAVFPQSGARLRIRTSGPGGVGCPTDTQVTLFNFAGELVRNSDSGASTGRGGACGLIDPAIEPLATQLFEGQYFIAVRGERDEIGDYVLVVEEL